MGNVAKDFSVGNMTKTGLYGFLYDFSVDYDILDVDDVLDIHKFLMKKHMFRLTKQVFIYY